MADSLGTPSSPLPPLTPSPYKVGGPHGREVEALTPRELTKAGRDSFVRQQRFEAGSLYGPQGRWTGLVLGGLLEARDWKPGSKGLDGKGANMRITAAYDRIDGAMRSYLGQPEIANWTTFGKYASAEAGMQIARLEAMLEAAAGDVVQAAPLIEDFFKDLRLNAEMGYELAKGVKTPAEVLGRVSKLRDALVFGNTQIMQDIGPAFDAFLRAEQAGQDGVAVMKGLGYGRPPLDPQGFLLQAFERYQAAHALGRRLAAEPPLPQAEYLAVMAERRKLVFEANVLIGIEEQMLCLQHPEAFGDPEVAELIGLISDDMSLTDARKTTRLLPQGGNWADFATRMGFKEVAIGTRDAFVIRDHDGVERAYVPHPDPKKREGTIYEYFRSHLDMDPSRAMLEADPRQLPERYSRPAETVIGKLLTTVAQRWPFKG